MKLSHSIVLALAGCQTALAVPVADMAPSTDLVAHEPAAQDFSPNKAHGVTIELQGRANICRTIKRTIHTIGTSRATMIYITSAAVLARSICNILGRSHCQDIADIIQYAFTFLFAIAAHASGAVPEGLGRREDAGESFKQFLIDVLEDSGNNTATDGPPLLAYDSVEVLPFDVSNAAALSRSSGDPQLVARVHVSGLRSHAEAHAGLDKVDIKAASMLPPANKTQDVILNTYADGTTVMQLPTEPLTDPANPSLGKRYDKPGFKVSYTTRLRTKLTKAHQSETAFWLSRAWATYADSSSTTDVIGFVETGHSANYYYRIIPEIRGFGLQYESVDICGGMAGFL